MTALAARPAPMDAALQATGALACLECGKCTAVCPLARIDGGASPRRMIGRAIRGDHDALVGDRSVWSCLTCGLCGERCPMDVDYPELLRQVRCEARSRHAGEPACAHGGTLQSLMRLMATPGLQQNRLDWVGDDLEVAEVGEVLLFVGCLPYFDAYFREFDVGPLKVARGAVRLLNRAGIVPALRTDERCCGHDLLWAGDRESYRGLAELNVEAIRESGAETVVTTCAECYRTLRFDYPEVSGPHPWRVVHLSEWLVEALEAGELELGAGDGAERVVTYHDPCRLGRHGGVFDAPRQVLRGLPGVSLVEMDRSRERALCCGTSAWLECDSTSRAIQAERLTSAAATEAATLVTCCPKCNIHFNCALQDASLAERVPLKVEDLTVLVADAMPEVSHD